MSRIRSSHHFAAGAFANFGFERTLETYNSSVVLVRKFSWRTRGGTEENFRTTTLANFGKRWAGRRTGVPDVWRV